MFSKVTAAFLFVSAPAGVWLAAQPAPVQEVVAPTTVAQAELGLVSRDGAISASADFLPGAAISSELNHDAELDRLVWRVSDGKESVRVDAHDGDVVELAW